MAENEGEFLLKTEPTDNIVFKGEKLGEEPALVDLKLTNPTNERRAFKVKCTSNEMFRIRPPVSTIEPYGSATVQLTFKGNFVPESGKHYFVVYHIKCDDDARTPRKIWDDHNGDPEGSQRLIVDFDVESDSDADKKPEDKVDEEIIEIINGADMKEDVKKDDMEKIGNGSEYEGDENKD
uniref:Major sperm protein n=1 Tax=Plectus sambesii TaxID=2011161 RepID=A0A914XD43_9BILA